MDLAEGKLKTPGVMAAIELLFKTISTYVALVKLKAPAESELILLYDKLTTDRDGNLEIWFGIVFN